jgi:predicted RND superfamily exporter protein
MLRDSLELHGFAPEPFAYFFADFQREREEIVHIDNPALRPMAFLIDHHVRARRGEYIVATYIQPAASVSLGTIATRLHDDLGEMRFTVAGRTLLEESLGLILRRELVLFLVAALVGNLILLLISLGSLGMALVILAPPALAVVALSATMWALGLAIDPVNLAAVPLILGLGVDDAVYIIAAAGGRTRFGKAFRHGGRALVITSLTTVAGFGFLGLSRYPALATMGRLSGAGLFLCMILTVVLLPALLSIVSRARER